MAIQMTITLPSDIEVVDAYHKIRVVTASKSGHNVVVDVFKDQQASIDAKLPANGFSLEIPWQENMEGNNVLANCYNYMMTMSMYDGATIV